MQAEELKQLGGLVFRDIEEGFQNCKYEVLSGNPDDLYEVIVQQIHQNGLENSYVDFYYGRLKKEEQEKVQEVIPNEWLHTLKQYENCHELYYPLNKELLEITWFLTIHEYLFSTYYFCKEPCTIWGNYNQTLVKFWL